MTTNWKLIRELINSAIDTCERIEASGFKESDRDAVIDVRGQSVSVQDFLTSAWTAPENLRYAIIRARHEDGIETTYTPETARIIVSTAQAVAELIGAGDKDSTAAVEARKLVMLFNDHISSGIEHAIAARHKREKSEGKTE